MSMFENIIHTLSYFILPALIIGAVLVIVGIDFVFMKNPGAYMIVDNKGKHLTRLKGFLSGVGMTMVGVLIIGCAIAAVLYSTTNVCSSCGERGSAACCTACCT